MSPGPVLVLNAGSSSLKAALVGTDGATLWREQRPWSAPVEAGSPETAIAAVLESWLPAALAPWHGRIALAGHRVVHGGEHFRSPTRIDATVLAAIEGLVPLAPLHNAPALAGMRWLAGAHPELVQWACFDTAFHGSLPPEAFTYAIPPAWRRQGLRRFGFHGLNHQHVAETVAAGLADPQRLPELRLISCHLGAGCSLCAIRGGRSIATTMGFTPMEGLVMASRSGSVDPGLVLHQLRRGLTVDDLDRDLNGASGLLGLSELSGDMATLRGAAAAGHAGARLAIDVFLLRLLQEIGAMAACLEGVDVIALSGGIGEHDRDLAEELRRRLAWLGPVTWQVVPADEEGMIARNCRRAMG